MISFLPCIQIFRSTPYDYNVASIPSYATSVSIPNKEPTVQKTDSNEVALAQELLQLRAQDLDIKLYGSTAASECAKEVKKLLDEYVKIGEGSLGTQNGPQKITPQVKDRLLNDFLPRAITIAGSFADRTGTIASAMHIRLGELISEGKNEMEEHLRETAHINSTQINITKITTQISELGAARKSLLTMSSTAKSWQEHFQAISQSLADMETTNS